MTSVSTPPTLRPRWSSASSTESFMCLPMTPAGPDRVVMKPIFTGSAARACAAKSAATSARTRTPRNVRTGWPPCLARDSSTLARDPGDGVDLHVDAGARRARLHRGARRLHALEVVAKHAIERVEVLHVAQEHAHLHHVLQRRARRLQHLGDVVERHARLLGDVRGHHLLRHGVERSLSGDEDEISALHALRDGRLHAGREARGGRRFRVDDFWFHAGSPLKSRATSSGIGPAWIGSLGADGRRTQARTSKPVAHARPSTVRSYSMRNVLSLTQATVT